MVLSFCAGEKYKATIPLLTPYNMGPFHLCDRIVYAPLTRCRAIGTVPQPAAIEYYTQRARKGGFILSEGTSPSRNGYGCVAIVRLTCAATHVGPETPLQARTAVTCNVVVSSCDGGIWLSRATPTHLPAAIYSACVLTASQTSTVLSYCPQGAAL